MCARDAVLLQVTFDKSLVITYKIKTKIHSYDIYLGVSDDKRRVKLKALFLLTSVSGYPLTSFLVNLMMQVEQNFFRSWL